MQWSSIVIDTTSGSYNKAYKCLIQSCRPTKQKQKVNKQVNRLEALCSEMLVRSYLIVCSSNTFPCLFITPNAKTIGKSITPSYIISRSSKEIFRTSREAIATCSLASAHLYRASLSQLNNETDSGNVQHGGRNLYSHSVAVWTLLRLVLIFVYP